MKHFETSYTTHDGLKLYLQAWMPDEEAQASLLLVHGLGEHSSRYLHVAEKMVETGVSVFTFDGRGHGKSVPLPTAYFDSYKDYLKDIDALYEKVKTYVPQKPSFIFGHSMGGGLVAAFALEHQPKTDGVILSAPALMPDDNLSPFLIKVSGFVSAIAPKLKVLKLDATKISRDVIEVEKYKNDPLVYQDPVPARTGHELLKLMNNSLANANQFSYPVLLLHGTADELTNPKGTEQFFRKISSKDKTFHRYEGLYHELVNEPEKEKVIQDIVDWVKDRM
ncbi:alpha/beta hydrolase [Mongoliitalea daihaiensis]|uniref:alpha/beta hydrolase n=1 Tax=Mongoliitalea daihaiensis TaxID=2782006 RepID=UPI001F19FA1D|nr:alpha/beta hydrolase [Mongoliitalea daihaiensis]UJP64583.1 alpha/beta hydrolase [Mongoliitalea daihaiensis]